MRWLLDRDYAADIQRRGSMAPVSAEHMEKFQAECAAAEARVRAGDSPRNFKVAGDVAEIGIRGVLVPRMDFILWLFGFDQTTYRDIQAALALADADPAVKRGVYNIHSPGGAVDGLFETLDSQSAFSKPTRVNASYAASAAYALAANGGRITATNAAASFGSVGVVSTYYLDDTEVEITSTEAPDKRPDLGTEEGKAVIIEYLDQLHELLAARIAAGRSAATESECTTAQVNAEFGRGRMYVAGEARKRKMIDTVQRSAPRAVTVQSDPELVADPQTTIAGGGQKQESRMDLKTLRNDHEETYDAAVKAGVDQERDRVVAHLTMGVHYKNLKLALESIESGAEMTQALRAKYETTPKNHSDQEQYAEETGGAAASSASGDGPQSLVDLFAGDLPGKKQAS